VAVEEVEGFLSCRPELDGGPCGADEDPSDDTDALAFPFMWSDADK
jgi:hypothetical protein